MSGKTELTIASIIIVSILYLLSLFGVIPWHILALIGNILADMGIGLFAYWMYTDQWFKEEIDKRKKESVEWWDSLSDNEKIHPLTLGKLMDMNLIPIEKHFKFQFWVLTLFLIGILIQISAVLIYFVRT